MKDLIFSLLTFLAILATVWLIGYASIWVLASTAKLLIAVLRMII